MAANRLSLRKKRDAGDSDAQHHRKESSSETRTESGGTPAEHERTEVAAPREPVMTHIDRARGGVSAWSVLSGTLVAFGAFIVIAAIVGSILAASGVAERGINPQDMQAAGVGSVIGLVVAQFLAYLWGGYTAGRMARGSGALNGILVAITALVVVVILAGVVALIGPQSGIETPDLQTFPLPPGEMNNLATWGGVGVLVAMLLGSGLGGKMGARWHTKMEDADLVARVR
ncbi:MAG: hypothetical protein WD602_02185 [Actinomycetota bacterium]